MPRAVVDMAEGGAAGAAGDGTDRRRASRKELIGRADYSTIDEIFSEFTRDINEGGLFIETDDPCAVDPMVSLSFDLPNSDEPIQVSGRVVWVEEDDQPGMGIEFEVLSPESSTRIDAIVRSLRTDHAA